MASVTILSDNGATSGSAGLKTSGGNDGVLLLQTTTAGGTPTTAISISNTQVVTYTNQPTYTGGTANGVLYLNGSKAVTSGTALVFDGSNLGIGVTPSAWGGSYKALQVNSVGSLGADTATVALGNNTFWNGSSNRYLTSAAASLYYQNSGQHVWLNAGSGTAGNTISFTQAMTLDASGNWLLGTTTALTKATVFGTGDQKLSLVSPTGSSTQVGINLSPSMTAAEAAANPAQAAIYATDSSYSANIIFANKATGALGNALTERARIDTSGRLLIGATSSQAIGGSVQTNLQLHGTGFDAGTTGLNATSWYTGAGYGGNLFLGHIRSGTVGSQTATVVGTELGNIIFGGSTGSVATAAVNIVAWSSDSTWTGSSTPAYLSFSTVPPGSTTGLERMRLNSSGQVLLPYQPAFMATTQASTFTPASAAYNYSAVKLNRGGHYNSSTGRFTAPVGGVYYFVHQITARPTSSSVIEPKIYVNGFEYARAFVSGAGNTPFGTTSLTISLSANDYVEAAFYNGNSPAVVLSGSDDITSGSNGIVSGWMGWLLG